MRNHGTDKGTCKTCGKCIWMPCTHTASGIHPKGG
jgi:hypothetical protein